MIDKIQKADIEERGVELGEESGAEVWVEGVRKIEDGEVRERGWRGRRFFRRWISVHYRVQYGEVRRTFGQAKHPWGSSAADQEGSRALLG